MPSKFSLGRRKKVKHGEHAAPRCGTERVGGVVASGKQRAGAGGSAAAPKPRKTVVKSVHISDETRARTERMEQRQAAPSTKTRSSSP